MRPEKCRSTDTFPLLAVRLESSKLLYCTVLYCTVLYFPFESELENCMQGPWAT